MDIAVGGEWGKGDTCVSKRECTTYEKGKKFEKILTLEKNYLKEKVHLCIYIMTDSGTVIKMYVSFV